MRVNAVTDVMVCLSLVFGGQVANAAAAQMPGSRIIRECTAGPECLPTATNILVVRVVDVAGDGISEAPVEIVAADASVGAARALPIWRTDKNGAVAGSLHSGERYRIRINIPGFFAFESETRVAKGATTEVVTVELRVPPIVC